MGAAASVDDCDSCCNPETRKESAPSLPRRESRLSLQQDALAWDPPQYDVFICHVGVEKSDVTRLHEALVGRGARVFFDLVSLVGIPAASSRDFGRAAAKAAPVCVLIIGHVSDCAKWPLLEVADVLSRTEPESASLCDSAAVQVLPYFVGKRVFTPDAFRGISVSVRTAIELQERKLLDRCDRDNNLRATPLVRAIPLIIDQVTAVIAQLDARTATRAYFSTVVSNFREVASGVLLQEMTSALRFCTIYSLSCRAQITGTVSRHW